MLVYLALFLSLVNICSSDLTVKNAGLIPINEGDIALVFFLTLENECNEDVQISLSMTQCCQQTIQNDIDCNSMYLIGGNMGILYKSYTRNITLIYPNLYLLHRQGTCTIAVKYETQKFIKILTKEIEFKTNATTEYQNQCKSLDMDDLMNCSPVDCVTKYSGGRSFFNPTTKSCEFAQICMNELEVNPSVAYSWTNNECINLNEIVTKYDLQTLEGNQVDTTDEDYLVMSNFICHHGDTDSNELCQCQPDWKTSLNDDIYEPSLALYHMCNIETGGWNCVNSNKIQTTAIIIAIFSLTIATKILILMCILNWCYKHYRNPKEITVCTDTMDPEEKNLILINEKKSSLEKCICNELKNNRSPNLFSEVVNVSYYPCAPSTISSLKMSMDKSRKCSKCHSQILTTTSSSTGQFSYETDSDSSSDSNETEEEDYEIEFGEEQDFCGDENCSRSVAQSDEKVTGLSNCTDYTTSNDNESKKGSKESRNDSSKSKTTSRKSSSSNKKRNQEK